jgi:hypothetical protein
MRINQIHQDLNISVHLFQNDVVWRILIILKIYLNDSNFISNSSIMPVQF